MAWSFLPGIGEIDHITPGFRFGYTIRPWRGRLCRNTGAPALQVSRHTVHGFIGGSPAGALRVAPGGTEFRVPLWKHGR